MKRICLLSDTHGTLDDAVLRKLEGCDELWHGGDVGTVSVLDRLEQELPVRGVYGNIDGSELRTRLPLDQAFECEGVSVAMTHIAGRPGRYPARVRELVEASRADLFICGHSHILLIERNQELGLLHVNPGACGNSGFHKVKTLVRFTLTAGEVSDMEVVEWDRG